MTEFGKTLEPVLLVLKQWAEQQMLPRMNLINKEVEKINTKK